MKPTGTQTGAIQKKVDIVLVLIEIDVSDVSFATTMVQDTTRPDHDYPAICTPQVAVSFSIIPYSNLKSLVSVLYSSRYTLYASRFRLL